VASEALIAHPWAEAAARSVGSVREVPPEWTARAAVPVSAELAAAAVDSAVAAVVVDFVAVAADGVR
jgi:hypothetical protein